MLLFLDQTNIAEHQLFVLWSRPYLQADQYRSHHFCTVNVVVTGSPDKECRVAATTMPYSFSVLRIRVVAQRIYVERCLGDAPGRSSFICR